MFPNWNAPGHRYDRDIVKRLKPANHTTNGSRKTRELILKAADRILRSKGLMGASTREIARAAGVADGTLYVHFKDRIDLFLALIEERIPAFIEPLRRLEGAAGKGTVRENLVLVLEGALAWHRQLHPMAAAVSGDPALRSALKKKFLERNEGPHRAIAAVQAYLAAEQQLGRVHPRANLRAAALMLFGASHFWNAASLSVGNDLGFTAETLTEGVMEVLLHGIGTGKSDSHSDLS